MILWGLAAVSAAAFVAAEMKTSRHDGKLVRTHPYRRMLPYLMPTKSGATVYYDDYVDADQLTAFIETSRQAGKDVDVTACIVAAVSIALDEAPKMNRFLTGGRIYQRNSRKISFSALRRARDRSAKTAAIHLTVADGWVFDDLLAEVNDHIEVERSGRKTYTDKELSLFLSFPRVVLGAGVGLLKWLDRRNLLPASFIDNDPLFCSAFLANIGSIDLHAAYHHLYDWGNCPAFVTAGKIEPMPVVVDGAVVVRNRLHLRYSFDERIDDGMNANDGVIAINHVLENPFAMLGCLAADGSDRRVLKGRAREI